MSNIAHYRVSTQNQSIESQRVAMGGTFDEEFDDVRTSCAILAAKRPGFGKRAANTC